MPVRATLHVMAGVLTDAQGRVLIAQRPPGKHLAGLWEFPGGKREPGETAGAALLRELDEELGIRAEPGGPLISVPWRVDDRSLRLDAWRIKRWQGEVTPREGQAVRWIEPRHLDPILLTPADRPVLAALILPHRYAITPDRPPDHALALRSDIEQRLDQGTQLIQLRLPRWPVDAVRRFAAMLLPQVREAGASLLLNADIEGAHALGAGVGVQLRHAQLMALEARPLPWPQLVGASCHDAASLAKAAQLAADFALLSPVCATASHPLAPPLGWRRFASLGKAAALPVYALGGMDPDDVERARRHGGQGVAGIGRFWP